MPGRNYEVTYQDDNEATVESSHLCPYCNQETTALFTAGADGFALLEIGSFFEPLECENCHKIADVRFFSNNRI